MRIREARLYYGWIVVAIGFTTMMLIMGIFFSSGVLFMAITAEYGWSRASASLPFSVALICYAATAWMAGHLFDRYGPRRLFPVGAMCTGVGLIASAQIDTLWQLSLTWGLLVAQGFNLAGFAPHLAQVALWFNRRRGIASGLILSGSSVGALVLVPSAQYMVDHFGWRLSYTLLGVLVMVCLVPLNAFGQRHRPSDMGLHPDGDPASAIARPCNPPSALMSIWTLWLAMRTARFWLLFALVCSLGWLNNITTVHQIAHIMSNGSPSMLAAAIVGIQGLLRAGSSALWGGLSDRFGRESIFTLGTLFCSIGLACLALWREQAPVWLLYGFALTFGLGYGAYGSVYAAAIADLFHSSQLGIILGALEMGWGLGGFGGAWFGGFWFDHWGSYHGAFVLTIGINLVACLALWLAGPRHLRRASRPPPPIR